MSCWEFDLGSAPSCSLAEGGYTKVQFATQDITSWPLDPPDWSTPTVLESPFTVPEIGLHAPLEAGLMGANEISLECDNRDLLDSVGDYSGVRIFDLLRGRVTGDTFDVDVTDLHVRILFKSPTDLDYSVRWWGIVDYKDLEARLSQLADPDTFYIKLHAIDSIFQLEKRNMIDFVTDMDAMQMSNAYTSDYKFLSFYGTLVYGTQTIRPGAYELVNVRWYDGSRTDWLGNRRSSPTGDSRFAVASLRYFRLVDILQAVHDYLGLEAASVNNGATWSTVMPWRFVINKGDPTSATPSVNTDLTPKYFDELYIVSGVYVYDGTQDVYAHRGTFFDRDGEAAFTFMDEKNPLEMLKRICTSFGMIARVAVNANGERYLEVRMADDGNLATPYFNDAKWLSEVEFKPYARSVTGIEVVTLPSPNKTNIVRGSTGSGNIKIDCSFGCANSIRTDADFRRKADDTGDECVVGVGNSPDFWGALWASDGTLSTKNWTRFYSVCAIVPALGGVTYADSLGGTEPYIQTLEKSDGGAPVGEVVPLTIYNDINVAGINPVIYPNSAQPVNSWCEVPAMALAHYYFSNINSTKDILGLYRTKGAEIKIARGEIFASLPTPGSVMEIEIDGETYVCRVVSAKENLRELTTEFDLEVWTV